MVEIAAVVLAAGLGSRFGEADGRSKLVAALDGTPMVRCVVETALASRASPVIVVTGHAADAVTSALAGLPIVPVHNAAYADGMAGSLKAGLAAVPARSAGAFVLLADMPRVRADLLDAMIDAFARNPSRTDAVVPVHAGRPGNPVLIGARLFTEIARLEGDGGARGLLAEPGRSVVMLPVADPGIAIDVDTPEALRRLRNGE